MTDVRKGDWVRFQSNGRLVVAQVEYVRPLTSWDRSSEIVTTEGAISRGAILESRRDPAKEK
jgi:hypothetical protein